MCSVLQQQPPTLCSKVLKPSLSMLEVYKKQNFVISSLNAPQEFFKQHFEENSSLQGRIFNKLLMAIRRNMTTIVVSKSNKAIDSNRRHTIEYFSTRPLKTKSFIELYA
jgi:hypothetical protein